MLSDVERSERLRTLHIGRRLLYNFALAFVLVAGFFLTVALGIALMLTLAVAIIGVTLVVPDDILVLGFPVLLAFLLTIGLIGLVSHEGIPAGQTIGRTAFRSLRGGLIKGFIIGLLFGVAWALILQNDIGVYALLLGIAVAVAYGLFDALSSVAEPVCWRLVGT